MTHSSDDLDTPAVLLPTKLEQRHPNLDLSQAYRLSRMYGLSPEQKSFAFKLMHSLLPTRDRLTRMGKVQSSDCIFCDGITDTAAHLMTCRFGSGK